MLGGASFSEAQTRSIEGDANAARSFAEYGYDSDSDLESDDGLDEPVPDESKLLCVQFT